MALPPCIDLGKAGVQIAAQQAIPLAFDLKAARRHAKWNRPCQYFITENIGGKNIIMT